jgi:two-component system sensor histidine kinase KdpD
MLTAVLLAYWGFSERTESALMREERLRRIAEEQRHAAETERLEHLVHSKDQFIASVSHELRTPLTAVVGFAELLANEDADLTAEDRSDLVTTIAREASDLSAIVEDLLVAARSELGTIRVTATPVDVRGTVDLVLRALPTSHRLRITVSSDPSTWALGDPARLRQIIRNLVSNAVRYGGPNIGVEVEHDQTTTAVRVIDDGPGIPDADRNRIFLPYEVTGEAATQPASVGLGLTVSRDLAERMGGTLTYDHSNGRSVFEVLLPNAPSRLVTSGTLADSARPETCFVRGAQPGLLLARERSNQA